MVDIHIIEKIEVAYLTIIFSMTETPLNVADKSAEYSMDAINPEFNTLSLLFEIKGSQVSGSVFAPTDSGH